MLATFGRSLRLGLLLLTTLGLLEAMWYLVFGDAAVVGGARLLTTGILLYAVLGLLIALPVSALAVGLTRKTNNHTPTPGWLPAYWSSLLITITLGWLINNRWLGGFLDPTSLAADAALLVIVWPILHRLLLAPCQRVVDARCFQAPGAWGGALLLIAGFGMLSSNPTEGASKPSTSAPEGAPNILFVLVDTLRADHLSCYGYQRNTSPVMDSIAEQGLLFENCISSAPHTKPSTASILTSLHPPTHRVERFTSSLDTKATTLPEALHAHGWRTSLMSANTFLSPTYGFGEGVERFRGSVVNPAFQLLGSAAFHRLRRTFVHELHTWRAPWDFFRALVNFPFLPQGNPYQHGMSASQIDGEFFDWLETLEAEEPWFAYLQYMEPHAPYQPAPEHRIFGNPPADSMDGVWFPSKSETMFLPFAPGPAASEQERTDMIANYDSCIHEVDAALGKLFQRLEERGDLENTLVVITSDHGEEFFEHGAWGHGHSLHRELIHVPLILRWPAKFKPERIQAQVRSIDIFPTILALCGIAPPGSAQGLPLPLLANSESREGFSEVLWGGHWARSLRSDLGTLIHASFEGQEVALLYAEQDTLEQKEHATSEPLLKEALLEKLHAEHQRFSAQALEAKETKVDEGTLANLAEIGYLDEE